MQFKSSISNQLSVLPRTLLVTVLACYHLHANSAGISKPGQPAIELTDSVEEPASQTRSIPDALPTEAPSTEAPSNNSTETLAYEHVIGWASVYECGPKGTTGGGSANVVSVNDAESLISALTSDGPKVITVEGTITDVGAIKHVTDKTLIGRNGAVISGGIRFTSARNVIIKNIEFADGSNDTFELSSSECVWFDHNTFRDGLDGNLDIVRGSNYITVSWNRFYYTKAHDHMLSNLNGNTNNFSTDEGKIKVTFHHNWWGSGVKERMPRVRYGDTHIFNNYYKYEPIPGDSGQNYAIAAGQHSRLLVENNFFDGSNKPIIFVTDEGTAEVVHQGNIFFETTGSSPVQRGLSFIPPYGYTLDSAEDAAALVLSGAGPVD